MIPLELKLAGVRAFGNHTVILGGPEIREIVMFGPNGSGKSTIARMLQALVGDIPDDLQQSYLDERDTQVNRRASAELKILNRKGEFGNPDWPEEVTLGLEFGYENTRPFSRYYTVIDGKRQNYRTHEEYQSIFGRPPYSIKPDDRFMFIQQGESAALVQMRPRQRYETMKLFLGLEDLEKQWQETLDAKNRVASELRNAQRQHDALHDGLLRKLGEAEKFRQYKALSEELSSLERAIAEDDMVRHIKDITKAADDEKWLTQTLHEEAAKGSGLEKQIESLTLEISTLLQGIETANRGLQCATAEHDKALTQRSTYRKQADELQAKIMSIERIASEGLSKDELEKEASGLQEKISNLEKDAEAHQGKASTFEKALESLQTEVALTRKELATMEHELSQARKIIGSLGSPENMSSLKETVQEDLGVCREQETLSKERLRLCQEELEGLMQNGTATPVSALKAAGEFAGLGSPSAILCEAIALPEGISIDDRKTIEGALGDLRWAVMVEDGRIFVDYQEYTLADFRSSLDNLPAQDHGKEEPLPSFRFPSQSVLASRVKPIPGLSERLLRILNTILSSVLFAQDHRAAAHLSSQGFIAYTPDGYRYDRFGRKYSAPQTFCVGPGAYEIALEKSRESVEVSRNELSRLSDQRGHLEAHWARLEENLRQAVNAAQKIADLEPKIPETEARLHELEPEIPRIRKELESLRRISEQLKVDLALTRREYLSCLDRIRQLETYQELPQLKENLSSLRTLENRARKAAEDALEHQRNIEITLRNSQARSQELSIRLDGDRTRLSDLAPRIKDLTQRLTDKRDEIGRLQAITGQVLERYCRLFALHVETVVVPDPVPEPLDAVQAAVPDIAVPGPLVAAHAVVPDTYDLDLFEYVSGALSGKQPADESERQRWIMRQNEIAPYVRTLEDAVIPTAEEDYSSAKREFDRAEAELARVRSAFEDASAKEALAQGNFKRIMYETFQRISVRFQRYMEKFGWKGYLSVQPVHGTQFELQIFVSVYDDVEPRPLLRNRSGGETSVIAALLSLAMVKAHRRPFYVFDEIDQSLDPANVLKLLALLREEIDRKYIIISHRLNKTHLEQGQFGIGVVRTRKSGSKTRMYIRKDWPKPAER